MCWANPTWILIYIYTNWFPTHMYLASVPIFCKPSHLLKIPGTALLSMNYTINVHFIYNDEFSNQLQFLLLVVRDPPLSLQFYTLKVVQRIHSEWLKKQWERLVKSCGDIANVLVEDGKFSVLNAWIACCAMSLPIAIYSFI